MTSKRNLFISNSTQMSLQTMEFLF